MVRLINILNLHPRVRFFTMAMKIGHLEDILLTGKKAQLWGLSLNLMIYFLCFFVPIVLCPLLVEGYMTQGQGLFARFPDLLMVCH